MAFKYNYSASLRHPDQALEAQGLRHLAFCADDVQHVKSLLEEQGIEVESDSS